MSMAALPLPRPDRRGGGGRFLKNASRQRRGRGRFWKKSSQQRRGSGRFWKKSSRQRQVFNRDGHLCLLYKVKKYIDSEYSAALNFIR
jgi:hypothetical protein